MQLCTKNVVVTIAVKDPHATLDKLTTLDGSTVKRKWPR